MEKNTLLAVVLSTLFLIVWWAFFQPKPVVRPVTEIKNEMAVQTKTSVPENAGAIQKPDTSIISFEEKEIVVDRQNFKAVFTTRGAAIKQWTIKEKSGKEIELVNSKEIQLATFNNLNFNVLSQDNNKIVFSAVNMDNAKITKTYEFAENNFHKVNIQIEKKPGKETSLDLAWGPGLGCDPKEVKDNDSLTRVLAFPLDKPLKLAKLGQGTEQLKNYKWTAIDNRYFLIAFVPENNTTFDSLSDERENKKDPPTVSLHKKIAADSQITNISFSLYIGPKTISGLKEHNLNLDQTIDFGIFGFLGKSALWVLEFFYKITKNYGWAIVLLTILIQTIVFPLTIKSFKAQADMKRLQPYIKDIQTKYKSDPKRLNMEMLNIYKTHKVNPLGGCLPMLLQLPIFWALFTTLRNAYELRGAHWIFWIKDLSAQDPFYILPIIMGLGMLVQQRMVSITTDPMQAKLMYLMPVIFTFMFLNFPAGLVLYWITNSLLTMTEQYFFIKKTEQKTAIN